MFRSSFGFIFFLSFVGPAVLGPPEKEAVCGKSSLDDCLRKLQTFLNITNLPFTSNEEKLDLFCDISVSGYMCSSILSTTPDCLMEKDKDMILDFLPMAEYMQTMFCKYGHNKTGYRREDFLSNSDCLLQNREAIDCCAIETKIQSLPVLEFLEMAGRPLEELSTTICCPLSRYIQCVSAVARDNCGKTAFNLISEYILRAAGEDVNIICEYLTDYPDTGTITCPDPVKTCSGANAM